MATDYVLTAGQYRWIEKFRNEDHARRKVAARGYTLTAIVVATDETRREFAAWQREDERRNQQQADDKPPEDAGETALEGPKTIIPASTPVAPVGPKDGGETPSAPAVDSAAAGREFRVGRVLSRGFSILFRNLVPFCLLSGSIMLPFIFLPMLIDDQPANEEIGWPVFVMVVGVVVIVMVFVTMYYLVNAVVVYGTVQDLRGRRVSLGDCIRRGMGQIVPIIGVATVAGLAIIAGFVALIIPGFIVMTMLWVVIPVAVLERSGVMACLRRSAELTKGYRWRIFGIIFIVGTMQNIADKIGELVLSGTENLVVTVLVTLVPFAFFTALAAVVSAVGYNDLRVVKEGTDIEQIAAVFD